MKSQGRARGGVTRLTRKEWMIRIVALLIAASFLSTVLLAFFYR